MCATDGNSEDDDDDDDEGRRGKMNTFDPLRPHMEWRS